MKRIILAVLTTGFSCALLVTQQAKAVNITGKLDLGGTVNYDTGSLLTATTVTSWFDNSGTAGFSTVTSATGSYASSGINAGDSATMATPWNFNPSHPTVGLWSVGGFTFDLTGDVVQSQTSTSISITGTGIISGNGFSPTAGTWTFTSTGGSTCCLPTTGTFGFTASTAAAPDGGSAVALLGIAFAGIEAARRMFRARKA